MPRFLPLALDGDTVYVSGLHVVEVRELDRKQPGAGTRIIFITGGTIEITLPISEAVAHLTKGTEGLRLVPYRTEPGGQLAYINPAHIFGVRRDKKGRAVLKYVKSNAQPMEVKTQQPVAELIEVLNG